MSAQNNNYHPLDKYIGERMDQLDIEYNPSDWQSVKSMLQSHGSYSKPKDNYDFSKLKSLKIVGIIGVFVVILSLIAYLLIDDKTTEVSPPIQKNNRLELQENMIDSSIFENTSDHKINNIPNRSPELKQKENFDNVIYPNPVHSDSLQIIDAIEKNMVIDSTLIQKSKDTINLYLQNYTEAPKVLKYKEQFKNINIIYDWEYKDMQSKEIRFAELGIYLFEDIFKFVNKAKILFKLSETLLSIEKSLPKSLANSSADNLQVTQTPVLQLLYFFGFENVQFGNFVELIFLFRFSRFDLRKPKVHSLQMLLLGIQG
jgi:hypothetical protein